MKGAVIVPANITPTGFGISQNDVAQLFAAGRCCGGQVIYSAGNNEKVQCSDCRTTFKNIEEPRNTSIHTDTPNQTVEIWVAHWTGIPVESLEVLSI